MTIVPQVTARVDVVPSAGWNAILDKIQNGTDFDVNIHGKKVADVRNAKAFITGTVPAGTDADPYSGSAIQAAIDDLSSAGGMVFVPAGTWRITTPVIIKSSLTLVGAGAGTILKLGNAVNQNIIDPLGNLVDVTISDMMLDGNKAQQTAFTVLINLLGRCHVSRCVLKDSFGDGIFIIGEDCIISECFISSMDDTGIVVSGNVPSAALSKRVLITGNRFRDNTTAINIANDANFIGVVDNDIITSQKAIEVGLTGNGTTYPFYLAIDGNRIDSTSTTETPIAGGAAGATSGKAWIVTNNIIRGGKWGIHLGAVDLVIRGNYIEAPREYGILVDIGDKVRCIENIVKNGGQSGANQQGIRVTIADVDVFDNHVFDDQNTPTQDRGIVLATTSSDCRAFGNYVHGNITDQLLDLGTNNEVRRNKGFRTENRGTAVILNGMSSIVVAHGLAAVPIVAVATGRDLETDELRVSARDATNITLAVPSNVTAGRTVDWFVEA